MLQKTNKKVYVLHYNNKIKNMPAYLQKP